MMLSPSVIDWMKVNRNPVSMSSVPVPMLVPHSLHGKHSCRFFCTFFTLNSGNTESSHAWRNPCMCGTFALQKWLPTNNGSSVLTD